MKKPPPDPPSSPPTPERAATPDEVLKQLHEGRFEIAFGLAERLVQEKPASPLAHRLLAAGHLALGRADEALEELDRTVELHEADGSELEAGDIANVFATRALVQLQQDDLWSAEEDAQAALALNPDDPDALFVATVAAADDQRLDQALGYAARLAALDPESADAHAWLARILSAQGKKLEAARAAVRARELGFTTSELEDIERQGAE